MNTSVNKNNDVERYDVRVGHEWATIFITSGGLFAVDSSFGTYSHWWSHHGCETFKHFIPRLNNDHGYVMGKFGRSDQYMHEETIKRIFGAILEGRRDNTLMQSEARYLWDETETSLKECGSADLLVKEIYDEPTWQKLFYDYDSIPLVYDFDISLRCFMKEIFPVFVKQIEEELNGNQKESRE